MTGQLIGVGTGPGDPELLTFKAARAIAQADVIAYFAGHENNSNARATVTAYLKPNVEELPFLYPARTEVNKSVPNYEQIIASFFDACARVVETHLSSGRTVVVLSEGDPLFYGSYMHLHVRVANRYPAKVIPGITAMSGCWSELGLPLVQGNDVLTVLPGTLPEKELRRRLADSEACVIMKVGRNLGKVREALQQAGRIDEAIYIERGTMENMAAVRLSEKLGGEAPYFSLVLVPGWKGRP